MGVTCMTHLTGLTVHFIGLLLHVKGCAGQACPGTPPAGRLHPAAVRLYKRQFSGIKKKQKKPPDELTVSVY